MIRREPPKVASTDNDAGDRWKDTPPMNALLEVIDKAKQVFRSDSMSLSDAGLTLDIYHRYLSTHYHLAKGVQRDFFKCAGHPALSGNYSLRRFLVDLGIEEEPYHKVAEHDLGKLGLHPLACPLDAALWWAYFDELVEHRPFVRIGAACVLEKLAGEEFDGNVLGKTSFLNASNTRFLEIHMHSRPRGDQIIEALEDETLSTEAASNLVEGANTGAIIYLRLMRWAVGQNELTEIFSGQTKQSRLEGGQYFDLDDLCTATKGEEG